MKIISTRYSVPRACAVLALNILIIPANAAGLHTAGNQGSISPAEAITVVTTEIARIPEPSVFMLAGLGLLGIGVLGRGKSGQD
ncbi:MAG TPA: PEP-CTERM sorting domain-containing protein [Bryobacteraceae bacterium]|nr:PEP-CTERM sorting domain-containing protein [Bryobacteraceae bacterium]